MSEGAAPLTQSALYETQADYVWGALRRLGAADNDLEDLTHEVFMVAFKRLPSFDRQRPLRPWLFGIAARVAGHHRRWWRRRRENVGEIPESAQRADERHGADEAIASSQSKALIHRALQAVKLERRAVLLLHELEGVAVRDVAEALGIPVNTTYSRLRIGRAELAAEVERLSGGAP